jgi:hypothetical protein
MFVEDDTGDSYLYRNVTLQLSTDKECCAHQQWWILNETCTDNFYKNILNEIPLNDCDYVMMFLFNDKAFPESLSFISGFG